jgi:uncharacterized protein YceK
VRMQCQVMIVILTMMSFILSGYISVSTHTHPTTKTKSIH